MFCTKLPIGKAVQNTALSQERKEWKMFMFKFVKDVLDAIKTVTPQELAGVAKSLSTPSDADSEYVGTVLSIELQKVWALRERILKEIMGLTESPDGMERLQGEDGRFLEAKINNLERIFCLEIEAQTGLTSIENLDIGEGWNIYAPPVCARCGNVRHRHPTVTPEEQGQARVRDPLATTFDD